MTQVSHLEDRESGDGAYKGEKVKKDVVHDCVCAGERDVEEDRESTCLTQAEQHNT